MKKWLTLFFPLIIGLNFVSAQGFGDFYFGGVFSSLNIGMYLDALLFVAIFAIIYFALGKSIFHGNKPVSFIVSLCVSSFVIYGIFTTGFSFENLLYSMGISSDILPTILWMVGVVISLFLLKKFGFRNFIATFFALAGIFFVGISLLGIIYEQGAGLTLGIFLIILALIIHNLGLRRRAFKELSLDKQMDFKSKRAALKKWKKDRRAEQWNKIKAVRNKGGLLKSLFFILGIILIIIGIVASSSGMIVFGILVIFLAVLYLLLKKRGTAKSAGNAPLYNGYNSTISSP